MSAETTCAADHQGIHYRVLVLDEDSDRSEELELSFTTLFTNEGESLKHLPAFRNGRNARFYFAQSLEQVRTLPGASGYNMVWIHLDFPDIARLSEAFYKDNPFCYLVFYGGEGKTVLPLLHARPVAYVPDVSDQDIVHREMQYVWTQWEQKRNTLRLTSRGAYYDIPLEALLYCQSVGRKTLFYVDALAGAPVDDEQRPSDPFLQESENPWEYLAYRQNVQLNVVAEQLSGNGFLRVHQSFMVNRRFVKGLSMKREAWFLSLYGRMGYLVEVPVSGPYKKAVRDLFD